MAVSRRTNCSPVKTILPLMRGALTLAGPKSQPFVEGSGTLMKTVAPFDVKYYRPQCVFLPPTKAPLHWCSLRFFVAELVVRLGGLHELVSHSDKYRRSLKGIPKQRGPR